jgi:LmbE family N-acetylglucosaminyl deacetylase
VVLADNEVERALVVVAHPDDVDFWAGGAVACWTSAGTAVTYCVLSDGDTGGFDPQVPRSAIPGIRRAEQEAAAAVLGVSDVRFLGYPDGCIEPSYALRRDISTDPVDQAGCRANEAEPLQRRYLLLPFPRSEPTDGPDAATSWALSRRLSALTW